MCTACMPFMVQLFHVGVSALDRQETQDKTVGGGAPDWLSDVGDRHNRASTLLKDHASGSII